jgi:Cytochrome P460
MKSRFLLLFLVLLPWQLITAEELALPKELAPYLTWSSFPTQLLPVELYARCFVPRIEIAFRENEKADKGVHQNKYLKVYFNKTASDVIAYLRKTPFPEGSVLVKEKRERADGPAVELGAMIKKARASSSGSGDWEYLFVYRDKSIVRGENAAQACASCHAKAFETDYVFGNYAEKGPAKLALPIAGQK